MAKDAADKKTIDGFTRGRGRPRTSTPEKKKKDAAQRQVFFRQRQKLRNIAIRSMSEKPQGMHEWLSFLQWLEKKEPRLNSGMVSYIDCRGVPMREEITWEELSDLLLWDNPTELYFD